jgi:hypothetical protein
MAMGSASLCGFLHPPRPVRCAVERSLRTSGDNTGAGSGMGALSSAPCWYLQMRTVRQTAPHVLQQIADKVGRRS